MAVAVAVAGTIDTVAAVSPLASCYCGCSGGSEGSCEKKASLKNRWKIAIIRC